MSSPVLATKLFIPQPRARLVHRPRLIERLEARLPQRLTLISAPAGFGKTTLASEWAIASGRPVAWLSLDEAEGDPASFLVHVISAMQNVEPHLGEGVLGGLLSPGAPSPDHVLAYLVNEIARLPRGFTLVLDDYHLVDSRPVGAAVTFLVDHLPPQLELVVVTREDPQLPLARYRSRGQLVEIREADLRFTPAEAAEFLTGVMGLQLSEQDVAALESRTEGWIVGLQLAALSMRGLSDAAAFVESFAGTNRFVLDYLLEEVLLRQPQPIQDFLLATSILERLCGPLCDALVPEAASSGQDTLEALERANLFVVPLDHERRWYRYHHLFATLLQDRLARTQPDRAALLHHRAAEWFADNGAPDAAVRHAVAGRDWGRAAELLERFSDEWPMRAGVSTTLRWLEAIPAQVRLDRPRLGLTYAWSLFMSGRLDRAEGFLAELTPLVAADPGHLGEVFAIRLLIAANRRDVPAIVTLGDEALARIPPGAPAPRSRILISLGVSLVEYGGDLDRATRAFHEAYELGRQMPSPSTVGSAPLPVTALAYLAEIEWLRGRLRASFRMYEQAREIARQWGDQPSIALSLVHLGLAGILYEWDDLDGAALALADSLRIGEAWSNARLLVPALGLQAVVALAIGNVDEARVAIRRAETLARDVAPVPLVQTALAVHELALYPAATGWRSVERWQERFDGEAPSLPAHLRVAVATALARAWLARGHVRREADALARARTIAESALATSERHALALHRTRLHVLRAVVLREQGEEIAAREPIERALDLATPERYLRSFLDLGQPAEALVRSALDANALREPTAAHARDLLARFRTAAPAEHAPGSGGHVQEPLTQRELEVLRLIADGLSNREIADRLFLALSTVKGHARIVFDKLRVRRRTEAVARARELGLV